MVSERAKMKTGLGVLAATIATPVAIGVAFALLTVAGLGWFADKRWGLVVSNMVMYAGLAAPIALILSVVAGVPSARYLAKRRRTRALQFVLLGALIGIVPFLFFDIYVVATALLSAQRNWPNNEFLGVRGTSERLIDSLPVALYWLALGSWCGAWSAFAYWLVVHGGSPSNIPLQPTGSADTPPAKQASRQPSGG